MQCAVCSESTWPTSPAVENLTYLSETMLGMCSSSQTAEAQTARISAIRPPTNQLSCKRDLNAGEMFSPPMRWTGTRTTKWISSSARDPTPPTVFTFSPAKGLDAPRWNPTTAPCSPMAWDSNNSHRASWITTATETTTCSSPSEEAGLPSTLEKAAPSSQVNRFLSTHSSR